MRAQGSSGVAPWIAVALAAFAAAAGAQAKSLWDGTGPDLLEVGRGNAAVYVRHHSSPGWRVRAGAVEVVGPGRLAVVFDETPPERGGPPGHVAMPIDLDLAAVPAGRHLLEVRIRHGERVVGTASTFVLDRTADGLRLVQPIASIGSIEAEDPEDEGDDGPSFAVVLSTGGRGYRVDAVERDGRRIVARLTESAEKADSIRLALGPLPIGDHALVLEVRSAEGEDYRPIQVLEVLGTEY